MQLHGQLMMIDRPFRRLIECLVLFAGIPLVLLLTHSTQLILGTLLFASIGCAVYLIFHRYELTSSALTAKNVAQVISFSAVAGCFIFAFSYFYDPASFMDFPRTRPTVWLMVMLLYPLLSAVPQELVFRSFFFHRYGALFKSPLVAVFMNAALFALAHSMFRNPIAIFFTFLGGIIFACVYLRYRSLALTALMHAILGNLIFTSGLSEYFYHGRIQ